MTNRRRGGKKNRPPKTQAQRNEDQIPPPQPVQRPTLSLIATAVKVGLVMQQGEASKRATTK